MTILETIINAKVREVNARKAAFPIGVLKQSLLFDREPVVLSAALTSSSCGIIAEHKRRSPSKSVINQQSDIVQVVRGYAQAGVSAISVLTDTAFFGGALEDLLLARENTSLPLLRKDFMVDPYQFYEARAYGADAVLLIAAALDDSQLAHFSGLARDLGMEVLLEVHNEEELRRALDQDVAMIGVNNRDLKTFSVDVETSHRLVNKIPQNYVKVSESGISDPKTVAGLIDSGYQGFLMGEHFMKKSDPGQAAANFIEKCNG